MLRRCLFICLVISMAACKVTGTASNETTKQQLVQMELDRSRAIQYHDSTTLDKMYADNFNGVAAGGLVVNKPVLMDIFRHHTNDFAFINDDHEVKLINSKTAVLTGRLTAKDRQGNIVSVSRYSHVLVFTRSGWRIVYGQGTVVPQSK